MTSWNPDDVRISIARNLREIRRLYVGLGDEALHRAVGTDASDIDAINLAGPAANLEAWEHQYEAAEARGEIAAGNDYAADQIAELHPLLVLATWEDAIREEREQPTDLRATVERAADYLLTSLDWMLSYDENGDLRFLAVDELDRELGQCRRMLESVLRDGMRAERSRVTCVAENCDSKPPLVKKYGAQARWDEYQCPSCRARYNLKEFEDARSKNFRSKGTEKFVSVHLAKSVVKADRRTFWSWMDRLKTRAVCDLETREVMVWWPAVHELDEARRQRLLRKRLAAARRQSA